MSKTSLTRRIDRAIARRLAAHQALSSVAAAAAAPAAPPRSTEPPLHQRANSAEDYSQEECDTLFAACFRPGPRTRVDVDD